MLGVVAGAALLVVGAVLFATRDGGGKPPDGPSRPPRPPPVSQQDQPLPTGLTISRKATYEPRDRHGRARPSPTPPRTPRSAGPFLEMIPDAGGGCAQVAVAGRGPGAEPADDHRGQRRLRLERRPRVRCRRRATPRSRPGSRSPSTAGTSTSALQEWLDDAAAKTGAAVSDPELSGTAYPVQRMQGIEVAAPQRTVSQKTLRLSALPGLAQRHGHPQPAVPQPGHRRPVEPADRGRRGRGRRPLQRRLLRRARVSPTGWSCTALTVAPECHVAAQVGNFPALSSNTFAIVTRGG